MLETYQEKYANKNKQFVLLDNVGVVLESDQTIFNIAIRSSIMEFHPFFESLPPVLEAKIEENFYGVHILVKDHIYIVDINAVPEKEGMLLIIEDLTEHYNTYQSITQKRNESVIKTELTVLKNQELQERERFKNSFIQNFSHELRNPLTSIMAIIGLLEDTELNYEQVNMLNFLKESNTNLRLMLEDTLSIGMIDAGQLKITDTAFDLQKLFDLIQFTYQAKVKKKGLRLDCTLDDKIPPMILGDRLRLFQVITNLLDNALKYTDAGSIGFHVKLNQKRANLVSLRFEVIDTGVGISKENQELVFESFRQLQSNDATKGVGLGLTIAKKLLILMGAKLQLQSEPGKGSNFYFDISLKYQLFTSSSSGVAKSKEKSELVKPDQPKYKILVVEDDAYVQTTLFKILLNTKKYKVDLAFDGALVLQEVVNNQYDLILMDVNLPNLDGIQITKLIRGFPFNNIKNIPVIGITANAYEESINSCLKAGMQKVITKPYEKEELLELISKTLKPRSSKK